MRLLLRWRLWKSLSWIKLLLALGRVHTFDRWYEPRISDWLCLKRFSWWRYFMGCPRQGPLGLGPEMLVKGSLICLFLCDSEAAAVSIIEAPAPFIPFIVQSTECSYPLWIRSMWWDFPFFILLIRSATHTHTHTHTGLHIDEHRQTGKATAIAVAVTSASFN